MTPAEFRYAASLSGYGCSRTIERYMRENPRDEYTEADFEELYRLHERFMDAQNPHRRDKGRWHHVDGAKTTKTYTNLSSEGRNTE